MNKDFFKENKVLLTVFITFLLIFIIIATFTYRGLYFDVPSMFLSLLPKEEDQGRLWIWFEERRIRLFSSMLLALPYNLFYRFLSDNLVHKINLFTFSYYFMTFAAMLFNIYVAKRTGRYDIGVIAVAFFALFYLPGSVWFVRELFFAVMMQFALLQYFLSDEKLWKTDYILIFILSVYSFESFENEFLVGLIFFISSIFYYLKDRQKFKTKLFIGFCGLFGSIYVLLKSILLFQVDDYSHLPLDEIIKEYTGALHNSFCHIFQLPMLISVLAILFFIVLILLEVKLCKKHIPLAIIPLLVIFYLYKCNSLVPNVNNELSNYIMMLILFEPVMLFLIYLDYFDIRIKHALYNNLCIISCVAGIFGCIWQINSCKYSLEYALNFKNKLTENTGLVSFSEEDRQKDFMTYDTCFGILQRSYILYNKYEIKTLIVPDKSYQDYGNFCMMQHTYYDQENESMNFQTNYLPIKNRYHNLTYMIPYMEELHKTIEIKD